MNAMEDKMENHESQVGGNGLTLSDLSPSDSAAANNAGSIVAVPTT